MRQSKVTNGWAVPSRHKNRKKLNKNISNQRHIDHHLSIKTPMKPPSSSSVEILVNVSDGYNFHPRQKACIKCREGFQWILHRLFVGKPEPFALFIVAILSRARWNATQFFTSQFQTFDSSQLLCFHWIICFKSTWHIKARWDGKKSQTTTWDA